jgi:hypothetical protein
MRKIPEREQERTAFRVIAASLSYNSYTKNDVLWKGVVIC